MAQTEVSQWRDSVKNLYSVYVSSEVQQNKEGEELRGEFSQQRQHMERALDALKMCVERTEDKTHADFQKKLMENQALLQECNLLRVTNKDLRNKVSLLQTAMQQRPDPTLACTSSRGVHPSLRPLSAPRPGSGSSTSPGQLLRGSAIIEGRERVRRAEHVPRAEGASRESGSDRNAISMRKQVFLLACCPQIVQCVAFGILRDHYHTLITCRRHRSSCEQVQQVVAQHVFHHHSH